MWFWETFHLACQLSLAPVWHSNCFSVQARTQRAPQTRKTTTIVPTHGCSGKARVHTILNLTQCRTQRCISQVLQPTQTVATGVPSCLVLSPLHFEACRCSRIFLSFVDAVEKFPMSQSPLRVRLPVVMNHSASHYTWVWRQFAFLQTVCTMNKHTSSHRPPSVIFGCQASCWRGEKKLPGAGYSTVPS